MNPLLCVVSAALATPFAPSDTQPPNVLLIVADDLGYAELGSYGQTKIRTPHLDRLAAQGMRFTQAYSGNAVCAPSRCVLLSGMHPGHCSIRNNGEVQPEGQRPIPDAEVTVAELLRGAGYRTGAFGKWGLGFPGSEGDPLAQGFDRFFGYNCQRHAHSYYPSYLWDDRSRVKLDNDPPVPGHAGFAEGVDTTDPASYAVFKGQDYAPTRILDQLVAFLDQPHDKPFFAFYPTVIPHLALHVPDEFVEPYLALGWDDPPLRRMQDGYGYTPHFTPRAAYAGMISYMDQAVGRVLQTLEERGLADNTLVVFTSDNGATHLHAEVDVDFFQSVGNLRGLKGSLYEGGVRVPCVARWPGQVEAGSTCDRVIGFEDILPTLCDVSGAPCPADVDGISFLPSLRGEAQTERPFLYREFSGYGGQQSLRMGSWKAVRQGLKKGPGPLELYDLSQDPSETEDVSQAHPERVEAMRQRMRDEHVPSEWFPLERLDTESGGAPR